MKVEEIRMVDVRDPDVGVEINISSDQKIIHINVDGICIARIQNNKYLEINGRTYSEFEAYNSEDL